MNFESCFQLGYILKTHGLKGELVLVIDADNPQEYSELESVFVEINKKLVPFFMERFQLNGAKAISKFEEIDSIEQAKGFKGAKLYLPLDFLPELEGGYYFHELIGFKVIDSNEGELGVISGVFDSGSQDLMAMQYQAKEVLIPLTDEVVTKVDKIAKTIYTTLPNGLLDIYLLDDAD